MINSNYFDTKNNRGCILMLVHKNNIGISEFLYADYAILLLGDSKNTPTEFY